MSSAGARHVKALEKVFLGIRSSCDEKLQQLEAEFQDHQDWLAKTITDTRESKDALGLVCPPTTRKANKTASRFAEDDKENKENLTNNSTTAKQVRSGKRSTRNAQETDENSMTVFEPEADASTEPPPAKHAKSSSRAKAEPPTAAPKSAVSNVPSKQDLAKLKVVDLRAELQRKGLSSTGLKDDLVKRLAAAYEIEASMALPPVFVGKDVEPQLGMRVRHAAGKDHGSSRGLGGTIEIIPGRDARSSDERSASVRWDADTSDIRGPYYTGEPCDRGSGIGTSKYDLICIDPLPTLAEEPSAPETPVQPEQAQAGDEGGPGVPVAMEQDKPEEDAESHVVPQALPVVAAPASPPCAAAAEAEFEEVADAAPPPAMVSYVSGLQQSSPSRSSHTSERLSGAKRDSEGHRKLEATQAAPPEPTMEAWAAAPPLQQHPSASAAPAAADNTDGELPAPLVTPVKSVGRVPSADSTSRPVAASTVGPRGAVESQVSGEAAEKRRAMQEGTPVKMEPRQDLCNSAKKAQKAPDVGQPPVHDSVQQFRAIISRINADKDIHREAAHAPSSASRLPPRSNSITVAKPVPVAPAAEPDASAAKPSTWPPPASKVLTRPVEAAAKPAEPAGGGGKGGLTSEALQAHTATVGRQDMLGAFKGSRSSTASSTAEAAGRGAVAREASRLDASQRHLRAAENRAKLEEEVRRKAQEQERKRKELESKRHEAERIAAERRQREVQQQQEKLEAAKRRAQEEEERRIQKLKEEEERKRQERERAEQAERERRAQEERERERQAKQQQQQAAAAAKAAQQAAGGGLLGAIGGALQKVAGGVFGGAGGEQEGAQAQTKHSTGSAESGPTTIQIITEKNSDDDSDEEEARKKQVVPTWARSPHLRHQLERQVDQSPTPVFGECKKTCDLAKMFEHHQPKRRRYDKRTSSADWGEDGRVSFMERERFDRQVAQGVHQS